MTTQKVVRQPRFPAIALLIVLALLATACGSSSETTADDNNNNVAREGCPPSGTKIGYTPITNESEWFARIADQVVAVAAEECGVEVIIFDPVGDAVAQAEGIESMIQAGVSAISIAAVDGDTLRSVIQEAKEAGIYIVQHVSEVPAFDVNVGVPEHIFGSLIGQVGGEWLLSAKSDGAPYQVAILNADHLGEGLLVRKEGLVSGLEEALDGAEFEIVADVTGLLEDEALDATIAIIEANPGLDLILTINDIGALGALAGIESSGLEAGVDVAAVGSVTEVRALEAIIEGRIPGGITVAPEPHGDALVRAMFALLLGEAVEGDEELVAPELISGPEDAAAVLESGKY